MNYLLGAAPDFAGITADSTSLGPTVVTIGLGLATFAVAIHYGKKLLGVFGIRF